MSVTSPYVPPGVSVSEITSPSVTPLLASPADVCIVGLPGNPSSALSPLTTTDTMILSGTSPIPLPTIAAINNDASLVTILSVTNVLNPSVGTPAGAGYIGPPSAWVSGGVYQIGAVVSSAGDYYQCILGTTSSNTTAPISDTTHWTAISSLDYTFVTGEGGPDGSNATISRVSAGNIPNGTLVAVTYTYVPSDYWNPIRLYDIGSVESRFGPSWATASNASGVTVYTGIFSQLSMAARLAFANGAQSVICQPLFQLGTPGNYTTQEAATGAAFANSSSWSATLVPLRSIVNLDIIVPIIGVDGDYVTDTDVLQVFEAVQGHIAYQNSQELFIVGIFGEDGTSSSSEFQSQVPPNNLLRTHASTLQSNYGNALSSQCVLINNTVFQLPVPGAQGGTINVGGQYAAAAIAGAIASRPVSASMTRQAISGFSSITDPRAPADKNADAAAGLFVVENYNNYVRCRQGLTLDITDGPARSELSVVRAKFLLMESIQQTLDNQIIGQIIADANSPLIVQSAISGVLTLLQNAGTIVGYTPPVAQLSSINPTTITVTFSYQPAFPLNYIQVTFSLDLTTNTITSTTSTVTT